MAQIGGRRLVIIGGGLAGLSYLHYLRNFVVALNKSGHLSKITLLESNDYMGGSLKTNVFDDGLVHELGPRSIRVRGNKASNTVVLLEQLGLSEQVVAITDQSAAARDRYVYDDGQMYKLPSSLGALFTRLPNSKKTFGAVVFNDMFRAKKMDIDQYPDRDPPLFDFIAHRFGTEAAEKILDPMMRGITAGDARKLSTRAVFGDILDKEQAYGSVIKGMGKPALNKIPTDELLPNEVLESELLRRLEIAKSLSYSLKSGLQTISEHLSNSLLNSNEDGLISIYNQTKVDEIQFNTSDSTKAPCSVQVTTVDGDKLVMEADEIISAIPASDLARVLPPTMPDNQRKALEDITKIPHVPVGCVCVEYRDLDKNKLPKIVDSFGFLTNSKAGSRVLGISFDSAMFPEIDQPYNSTRMTCMIGGAWFKEMVGTDNLDEVKDTLLEEIALEEIRNILKLKEEPFRMSTLLWKTGIAQYRPGHKERLQKTRARIQELKLPLVLLGQSYDGFAVNDVVFASRMAAYNFVKSL